jgi:hypothetical protein
MTNLLVHIFTVSFVYNCFHSDFLFFQPRPIATVITVITVGGSKGSSHLCGKVETGSPGEIVDSNQIISFYRLWDANRAYVSFHPILSQTGSLLVDDSILYIVDFCGMEKENSAHVVQCSAVQCSELD